MSRTHLPWGTLALVAVLLLVHLVSGWTAWQAGYVHDAWAAWVAERPDNAMIADGGLFGPFVADGQVWRFATSPLLHQGLVHLLGNLIVLVAFGPVVEEHAGTPRMLLAFVLAALAGGALAWRASVPLVAGASGGALGVVAAALGVVGWGLVADRVDRLLISWCAVAFIVIETLGGVFLTSVSFPAHMGGSAMGLALALTVRPRGLPAWLGVLAATAFGAVALGGWLLG